MRVFLALIHLLPVGRLYGNSTTTMSPAQVDPSLIKPRILFFGETNLILMIYIDSGKIFMFIMETALFFCAYFITIRIANVYDTPTVLASITHFA